MRVLPFTGVRLDGDHPLCPVMATPVRLLYAEPGLRSQDLNRPSVSMDRGDACRTRHALSNTLRASTWRPRRDLVEVEAPLAVSLGGEQPGDTDLRS